MTASLPDRPDYGALIPPAGVYSCRAGCTAPLDRPGRCDACAVEADRIAHEATLLPARRSIPKRFRDWATLEALRDASGPGRVALKPHVLAEASRLLAYRVVVILGGAGRGKTSLACALMRAVIDAGHVGAAPAAVDLARRARYLAARDIAKPAPPRETDARAPATLATIMPFVVIDDVGAEAGRGATWKSDERVKAVADVLADRHDTHRRTVVTTAAELPEWVALYGDGVARRYLQSQDAGVVVVRLGGVG